MKPNIDFFPRAKKPTFHIPAKMFDPSKNRYWSEFLENTMKLYKTYNSRVIFGFTKKCTHRGSFKMENRLHPCPLMEESMTNAPANIF